jgi:hypothetical protein
MFPIQITVYRSIPRYFYSNLSIFRPYSVSDFFISINDQIKTYTSENSERVFSTVLITMTS